jgi:hypothetical protein
MTRLIDYCVTLFHKIVHPTESWRITLIGIAFSNFPEESVSRDILTDYFKSNSSSITKLENFQSQTNNSSSSFTTNKTTQNEIGQKRKPDILNFFSPHKKPTMVNTNENNSDNSNKFCSIIEILDD